MTKGTSSFGKRTFQISILFAVVVEPGRSTSKSTLAHPAAIPPAKIRSFEWGQKAKRRKTTGTGRLRYLKDVSRRFKNGFRENTAAKKRVTKSETA
ncbi:hypothetical protein DL96DRAFT_1628291 [Flagelloscypha sp. PMI_526]|nr:hypothetical protein DL96DRAFT_1628291 [Flagelloscypha sp. PMI_526]